MDGLFVSKIKTYVNAAYLQCNKIEKDRMEKNTAAPALFYTSSKYKSDTI